jgi:hypothetical protein
MTDSRGSFRSGDVVVLVGRTLMLTLGGTVLLTARDSSATVSLNRVARPLPIAPDATRTKCERRDQTLGLPNP